jgi:glycine/serine hydroxymethyltransferase
MRQEQMRELAHIIDDVIVHKDDEAYLAAVAQQIKKLCAQFVVYASHVHAHKQEELQQEL